MHGLHRVENGFRQGVLIGGLPPGFYGPRLNSCSVEGLYKALKVEGIRDFSVWRFCFQVSRALS